jgi:hypothetical protein
VNNSSPASTTPVSDTFTVLESFTGVTDTGKKFRRSTEKVEYLREYSKKIEIVTRLVYWGQEKLFEEKNQR